MRALQARGTGIETPMLHFWVVPIVFLPRRQDFLSGFRLGWPSGPRRSTQVRVSPGGVGSNPTPSTLIFFFDSTKSAGTGVPTGPEKARGIGLVV